MNPLFQARLPIPPLKLLFQALLPLIQNLNQSHLFFLCWFFICLIFCFFANANVHERGVKENEMIQCSILLRSKFVSVSSVFSLLVFHLSHLLFFLQTKTNVQERGVKENEMIQCNVPRSLAFNSKFVSVSSVVVFKQR